jgi:mRNA-degrading endonuclease RelE of RelBE toxin-antitoxin system
MSKPAKTFNNTSDTNHPSKIEQNLNINITPHVFDSLARLKKVDPELAKKALDLLQQDIQESHKEKQAILQLEQNEQQIRKEELPFLRKHAKRGQIFAFIIALCGLGASIFFGMHGMEKASIVSIATTLGVLAIQFLGKRSS